MGQRVLGREQTRVASDWALAGPARVTLRSFPTTWVCFVRTPYYNMAMVSELWHPALAVAPPHSIHKHTPSRFCASSSTPAPLLFHTLQMREEMARLSSEVEAFSVRLTRKVDAGEIAGLQRAGRGLGRAGAFVRVFALGGGLVSGRAAGWRRRRTERAARLRARAV